MNMTLRKRGTGMRLTAVLLAAVMVATACGSDSDDTSPSATTVATETTEAPEAPETTTAPTTEAPATTATPTTTTEAPPVGPAQGGDASVGLEAEAPGLRPWEDTCSSPCYNMMAAVFDKLFEQYADGSYGAFLAESISANDDFTVWTMNLRPDVVFHDGSELTAQTIADMFVVHQTGAQSAGVIASSKLVSVEATGDLEVTYTLSGTNAIFVANLSRAPIGMVFAPSTGADEDAVTAAANAPIGTGPFMIDSRDVDNKTVMVRNPNYWMSDSFGTQLPYLDSVTFHPIPDEGTRLSSLASGTVTAMQSLRQASIRDARNTEGLWLFEHQGNNTGGGMFNVTVAPYDDVRVRKGLITMSNQSATIAALGGEGISLPTTQLFASDSPFYSEAIAAAYPSATGDMAAGSALVQEYIDDPDRSDGLAVGEKISVILSCPPDPTLIAAMQVSQQLWEASGLVDVELTSYDQATHIGMAVGADDGTFLGTHDIHCWRWGSEDDPAAGMLSGFGDPLDPSGAGALNFSNWYDEEAYGYVVEATLTDDVAERAALYEKFGLIMVEAMPIYFSGGTATVIATAEGLGGLDSWEMPDGEAGIGHPSAEGRWSQAYWAAE